MPSDREADQPVYRRAQEILDRSAGHPLDLHFVFGTDGASVLIVLHTGEELILDPADLRNNLKQLVQCHVARVLADPKPYRFLSLSGINESGRDCGLQRAGLRRCANNGDPLLWIIPVRIGSASTDELALLVRGSEPSNTIWYVYSNEERDIIIDEVVCTMDEAALIWEGEIL